MRPRQSPIFQFQISNIKFSAFIKYSIALLFVSTTSMQAVAQDAAAVNPFLKKYAGTYHMLADGQTATPTSDKYVLTPNGKLTWTFYSTANADGSISNQPEVNKGTWNASDGLIQIYIDGMEDAGLLTDYRLDSGVFRAEGVFLKKEVPTKASAKKAVPIKKN